MLGPSRERTLGCRAGRIWYGYGYVWYAIRTRLMEKRWALGHGEVGVTDVKAVTAAQPVADPAAILGTELATGPPEASGAS